MLQAVHVVIHLESLESTTAAPQATYSCFGLPLQISYVHHNSMVHDKANLYVKKSTSELPSCRSFKSSGDGQNTDPQSMDSPNGLSLK